MHFTYPWALALLPLVAIPPLLHLMRMRRSQRLPFPSLMLLKETRTLVWRRYRLEELLLMAARTLAVLALVAMLAQPWARVPLPGWLAGTSHRAVLILDDSASMAAIQNGEQRFSTGQRLARRALEGLGPKSLAAVVSGGQGNRVLAGFQPPGPALRAIDDARPQERGTDLAGAVELADRMLAQTGGGEGRILIVSDFQRTGLARPGRMPGQLRSKARLVLIPVAGDTAPANLAWESVEMFPRQRRLVARGQWLPGQSCPVALERAGRTLYQARARADTAGRFALGFGLPGQDSLYLKIAEDALGLDDVRYLAGQPPAPSCLLVADEGDPGAVLLSRALAAMRQSGCRMEQRQSPTAKDLGRANVIIVAGTLLPGALQQHVADAARRGAGIILIPPEAADPGQYNQMLERLGLDARLARLVKSSPGPLRVMSNPSPLIHGLEPRDLGVIKVNSYWQARSGDIPELTIDGDPGLLCLTGDKVSAVLWLAGIQPQMSDLGYHTAFPVILSNAVQLLAGYGIAGQYEVGDVLRAPAGRLAELAGPGGSRPAESAIGKAGERYWMLDRPGWYQLTGDRGNQTLAVNLPARESCLEPASQSQIMAMFADAGWQTLPDGRSGLVAENQPLWRAILLFGLVLLAAEGWLRSRLAKLKNHLTNTV